MMKRVFLLRDFSWFLIPLGLAAFLGFFHFFKFSQTWTTKGIKLLEQKKPQSAAEFFVKILERDPFHPYAHLNLGLAYDMSDRPTKALKEYNMILKHFDRDSLQFFASFNTAELQGRLGSLEKALENYQRALSFSIEPERIKQNIELLFQTPSSQAGQGKPQDSHSKSGRQSEGGQNGESMAQQEETSSSNEDNPNSQDANAKGGVEGNLPEDQQLSQGSLSDSEQGQPQSEGSSSIGEISKNQAQSIMDEIEEQESNVRARQFQQNSSRRPRRNTTHKDW